MIFHLIVECAGNATLWKGGYGMAVFSIRCNDITLSVFGRVQED